jgi:hypothetical protein
MAQLLKLIDGADYTDVNDLMEASKCLKCEPDSTLEDFEIVIWLNAAMDAGLSAMTLAEVQAAIKCFFCLDPKAVKAAKTLLLCRISAIQSAPIVL